MRVATTRGTFEVHDESRDARGAPLVLVHGFPFDAGSWSADGAALAPRVRVIAPSMRGFGGSVAFEDVPAPSIDTMADDVAAVLDALALTEPVVLGGLSMGGYVALAFARRHGHRLRGLVLADTRAEPDSDEARANRDHGIARVLGGDLAGLVDALLPKILSPKTLAAQPAVVESVRAMALRAHPQAVAQALRAMRDRPDARPGLAAIAVPVLVVVGADDVLIPPAASEALASGLANARLQIIESAGHMSNLEQPAAFRAALAAFVAAL